MTGPWVDVAFWVFAVAAVWFGWRVFIVDSMVRATFSLLASFCNVGAIMVLLLAEYLGTALFFMMGVEMVVMAIFMIAFMMDSAGLNPMMMVHQRHTAAVVGALSAVALGVVALLADLPTVPIAAPEDTIRQLGLELMGGSMLLMQTVGLTLVATMVGSVILSAAHGRFGPADEGSVPPCINPEDPTSRPDLTAEDLTDQEDLPDEGGVGGTGHHMHHGGG